MKSRKAQETTKARPEVIEAIEMLAKEKDISEEMLYSSIEEAVKTAYKKNLPKNSVEPTNLVAHLSREDGSIKVYTRMIVVEEVENPAVQITLQEARMIRPDAELNDIVEKDVTPKGFLRVAAMSAKQVLTQRIRDAVVHGLALARRVCRRDRAVHLVARGRAARAHAPRRLARLPAAVRELRTRILRETLALVGELVEDRPHLRAGERREARRENHVALLLVGRHAQRVRQAEAAADLLQRLRADAALPERVQERLLHLQDALGRELDVVLGRGPDVVVDLDELGHAVVVRPEVDLTGVVVAARYAVELREADVG